MITADSRLPQPGKSSWLLAMLPPTLLGALALFLFPKSFEWRPAFLESSRNEVYAMRDGNWSRLPPLPGMPRKVRTSPDGTVWALLWHFGVGSEVARLDGGQWHVFHNGDFGGRSPEDSAGLVMDGENVWIASDDGLLRWDGRHWQSYHQPQGIETPVSMTAGQGRLWTIDMGGNLSEFDGSGWSTQKLALPGVKWDDDEADSPELARTGDGALWLERDGLWRSAGATWTAMTPADAGLRYAEVVGTTGDSVWLWGGRTLVSVGPQGIEKSFTAQTLGLSRRQGVFEVTGSRGRTFAAMGAGISEFDGNAWHMAGPLPGGVAATVSLAAGGDGDLVAIGNIPNPVGRRWNFVSRLAPLLLMFTFLAAIVWGVRRHKRFRLEQHLQLQRAVEHGTGSLPEEFARDERLLSRQSSWWSATVAVVVIVGSLMLYSGARVFWPRMPSWVFLAIATAVHLLLTLVQSLSRRSKKPWEPIEPGGAKFDWEPTRKALPGALAMFVIVNFTQVSKWIGDPLLWVLYGFIAIGLVRIAEVRMLNRAIQRGDYARALTVIRWFYFYNPESAEAYFRRGHILLLAGRYREAEEALRRAIARLRYKAAQATALEYLGEALLGQGRQAEAQRSYEAALEANPKCRRPYRGLAELMLREGRDKQRALEYVEKVKGAARDDYWSLRAWALAEAGRDSEVEQAAAEAIKSTDPKSKPDVAATYRRLGLAMQALDRIPEAAAFLKKAAEADPQGRWSALAKSALAERPVFRSA